MCTFKNATDSVLLYYAEFFLAAEFLSMRLPQPLTITLPSYTPLKMCL